MRAKKKDYKWSILISALVIIFIGIFVLVSTPFITYFWGIKPDDLNIYKMTLPSGYVIIGVGLVLEIIAFLPEIATAIRKVKK